MKRDITLSERSKELMEKIGNLGNTELQLPAEQPYETLPVKALIHWLSSPIGADKTSRFLLQSLRVSLLEDLNNSFLSNNEIDKKKDAEASWNKKFLFGLLAFAGTIVAICEGFDGIVSILGTFTAIPAIVTLTAGLAFSALSVIVFYGFDLLAISSNLGVKIANSPNLIDVLVEEVEQIEAIRKNIDDSYADESSSENLELLKDIAVMLKVSNDALDDARASYKNDLNNPSLNTMKSAVAAVTGVLFFGSGFYSGQSLALGVAALFSTSAAVPMAPIILTSLIVGIASFAIYWYVERPGLENLVGRWCGLDKENIDKLADEELVDAQKHGLKRLEDKITNKIDLQTKIADLTKSLEDVTVALAQACSKAVVQPQQLNSTPTMGQSGNEYSFFARGRSQSTGTLMTLTAANQSLAEQTQAACGQ